jgi:signal peptidase I
MSSGLTFEKIRTPKEIKHKINPSFSDEVREFLGYFLRVFLIVSVIFVVLKTNVYQVTDIQGKSMYPTLQDKDIVFIDLLSPKFSDYRRGDIVVLHPPHEFSSSGNNFIKRIIGLPGETVGLEDGKVYIYNSNYPKGVVLKENAYLASDVNTYTTTSGGKDKFVYPKLEANEYFVLGDNRGGSSDSRVFGKISKSAIVGRDIYRSQPSDRIGGFELPKYNITN